MTLSLYLAGWEDNPQIPQLFLRGPESEGSERAHISLEIEP